jgi:hypothetical protein
MIYICCWLMKVGRTTSPILAGVLPLSVVDNSDLSPTRLTLSLDSPYPC